DAGQHTRIRPDSHNLPAGLWAPGSRLNSPVVVGRDTRRASDLCAACASKVEGRLTFPDLVSLHRVSHRPAQRATQLARCLMLSLLWGCQPTPAAPGAPGPGTPASSAQPQPRGDLEPTVAPELAPSGAPSAESAVAAPLSFLKGQLHTHSAGSYDAKEPPDALLRFYAERGYDFVAITDHNRVTLAPPPSAAPSVSPLLVIAGAELTQNAAICSGPAAAPGYRCLFHTGALFLED